MNQNKKETKVAKGEQKTWVNVENEKNKDSIQNKKN